MGECRKLGAGKTVGPPISPAPTSCWPNQAYLSTSCAKLSVRLDRERLALGSSVESLCRQLRRLLVQQFETLLTDEALVVMCDMDAEDRSTVIVTLVSCRVWSVVEWVGSGADTPLCPMGACEYYVAR